MNKMTGSSKCVNTERERKEKRVQLGWFSCGASPCLLGHLVLVGPGQLIQVGLQDGLHLLVVGRAERGRRRLAEGNGRRRRGSPAPQRGSRASLLLHLVVQVLVTVGVNRHGRGPTVAVVPGDGHKGQADFADRLNSEEPVKR